MKTFKQFMHKIEEPVCIYYGKYYYELYRLDITSHNTFSNSGPNYNEDENYLRNRIIVQTGGDPESTTFP